MELHCRYCSKVCYDHAELNRHVDVEHNRIARFSRQSVLDGPFADRFYIASESSSLQHHHACAIGSIPAQPQSVLALSEPASEDSQSSLRSKGRSTEIVFSAGSLASTNNTTQQSVSGQSVFSADNDSHFEESKNRGFHKDFDIKSSDEEVGNDTYQYLTYEQRESLQIDASDTVPLLSSAREKLDSKIHDIDELTAVAVVKGESGLPKHSSIGKYTQKSTISDRFILNMLRRDDAQQRLPEPPRSHPTSPLPHITPMNETPALLESHDARSVRNDDPPTIGTTETDDTGLDVADIDLQSDIPTPVNKSSPEPPARRMSDSGISSGNSVTFSDFYQSSPGTNSSATPQNINEFDLQQLYNIMRSLVNHAVKLLEAHVQQSRRAATVPSADNHETSNTPTSSNLTQIASNESRGMKRKRGDNTGDSPNGDEDRNSEDEPHEWSKIPVRPECSKSRGFACFFWKNRSLRLCKSVSNLYKACPTPFPTWKLLMEHCYRQRKHLAPRHCTRCYTEFETEEAEDAHQADLDSKLDACIPRPTKKYEGITAKNRKEFKQQTKKIRSGAEKWKVMYKIIFELEDKDVPSPYFEETGDYFQDSIDIGNLVEDYKHSKLPRRIHQLDVDDENIVKKFRNTICDVLDEFGDDIDSILRKRPKNNLETPPNPLDCSPNSKTQQEVACGNDQRSASDAQPPDSRPPTTSSYPLPFGLPSLAGRGGDGVHQQGQSELFQSFDTADDSQQSNEVGTTSMTAQFHSEQAGRAPNSASSYTFAQPSSSSSLGQASMDQGDTFSPNIEYPNDSTPQQWRTSNGEIPLYSESRISQSFDNYDHEAFPFTFTQPLSSSEMNFVSFSTLPDTSSLHQSSGRFVWGSDMNRVVHSGVESYLKNHEDPVLPMMDWEGSQEAETE